MSSQTALFLLLAFAYQGALSATCGTRYVRGSSQIVSGTSSQAGEWPWQAQLLQYGSHTCGATVVGSNWIATAAHCVDSGKTAQYTTAVGHITSNDRNRKEYGVQKIITHPSYVRENLHNDVALVKIWGSFSYNTYVQPVCLPSNANQFKYPATGYQDCWATGWGSTTTGSIPSTNLRQVRQPIVSDTHCDYIFYKYTTSYSMCTGRQSGNAGICQGDSGGPLHCRESSSGPWYLAGIASFTYPSCGETYDGFARVGTYSSWMENTMKYN